jgi:hypothetical protein
MENLSVIVIENCGQTTYVYTLRKHYRIGIMFILGVNTIIDIFFIVLSVFYIFFTIRSIMFMS